MMMNFGVWYFWLENFLAWAIDRFGKRASGMVSSKLIENNSRNIKREDCAESYKEKNEKVFVHGLFPGENVVKTGGGRGATIKGSVGIGMIGDVDKFPVGGFENSFWLSILKI